MILYYSQTDICYAYVAKLKKPCSLCKDMTSFATFIESRKPEEQVPCCKRCLDSHGEKEIPTKERYLEFLKEDTFNINLSLSPKEAEIIYSALECLAREAKPINPKSHFEILRVIHLIDVAMLATVK